MPRVRCPIALTWSWKYVVPAWKSQLGVDELVADAAPGGVVALHRGLERDRVAVDRGDLVDVERRSLVEPEREVGALVEVRAVIDGDLRVTVVRRRGQV